MNNFDFLDLAQLFKNQLELILGSVIGFIQS